MSNTLAEEIQTLVKSFENFTGALITDPEARALRQQTTTTALNNIHKSNISGKEKAEKTIVLIRLIWIEMLIDELNNVLVTLDRMRDIAGEFEIKDKYEWSTHTLGLVYTWLIKEYLDTTPK